jgi:hypothetical protein
LWNREESKKENHDKEPKVQSSNLKSQFESEKMVMLCIFQVRWLMIDTHWTKRSCRPHEKCAPKLIPNKSCLSDNSSWKEVTWDSEWALLFFTSKYQTERSKY